MPSTVYMYCINYQILSTIFPRKCCKYLPPRQKIKTTDLYSPQFTQYSVFRK